MKIQFPMTQPSSETQDLILRPIKSEDEAAYFILNSDPRVMKSYGVATHSSPSETQELIQNLAKGFNAGTLVRWGIFLRSEPQRLIGDVGFWRFISVRCRAEVGAKLMTQHHRKGYMAQALAEALRLGFESFQINSVEGFVDPDNKASLRLIEKLGFQKEGYIEENSYDPHSKQFKDSVLVSLTKTRWLMRNGNFL